MIEHLKIKGFKCFDEVSMELKAFTLLAGANSVGKSTVIQAILAMLQQGKNPFAGEFINIGKVSELKNKYVGSSKIEIVINESFKKCVYDDNIPAESNDYFSDVANVRYLSADRVGVQDTYGMNLESPDKIGVRCEYAYQYLSAHSRDSWVDKELVFDFDSKLTFGGQVDYWLYRILGYSVKAEELERTDLIRVAFGNDDLKMISPKNVGTGVIYISEIIIAALSCQKGDILIIENPEIHLHPAGQSELMEFLTFIASNGIQIIMETHSDHIFNGIRKSVHKDYLENSQIAIYCFNKMENGCSIPARVFLTDEGIVKEQPEGMFDQIQKDLNVILGW